MAITSPHEINAAFARAFNARSIESLIALYEPDAVLKVDGSDKSLAGQSAIAGELQQLLNVPGTMTSRNNFCIVHGGLALLRADWEVAADDGTVVASGSSAELVRRQPDGTWRYVIDHAAGASVPRVL